MLKQTLFLSFVLALFALGSHGESPESLRFAKILSDNVVLQQGKPITVWGWGKPGTQVEVTLTQDATTGHKAETEADLVTKQDASDSSAGKNPFRQG